MGASFSSMTIDGSLPEKEMLKVLGDHCRNLCYEYGHDTYAGHLGIKPGVAIKRKTFDSKKEAMEFLEEHSEKWEPIGVVRYKNAEGKLFWLAGGWCPE